MKVTKNKLTVNGNKHICYNYIAIPYKRNEPFAVCSNCRMPVDVKIDVKKK